MMKLIFNNKEYISSKIVKHKESIVGHNGVDEVFSFKGVTDYSMFTILDELDNDITLHVFKDGKVEELRELCAETILGRFSCAINNIVYEFSYDNEAQMRFTGIGVMFLGNKITEIEWTAYENGNRVRIVLNKENFDKVSDSALYHQNSNVVKFNNLLKQVNNSSSIEELDLIKW